MTLVSPTGSSTGLDNDLLVTRQRVPFQWSALYVGSQPIWSASYHIWQVCRATPRATCAISSKECRRRLQGNLLEVHPLSFVRKGVHALMRRVQPLSP